MLIITNRNINKSNFENGIGDHNAFGDGVNSKGPNEVRIATANKINGKWQVALIKEPSVITKNNIPSQKEFLKIREKLTTEKRNCVFFVHGFNQDFEKNLEKSLALEKEHDVEVIAFSWPSNPGGFKTKEYRHAKRTAKASLGALDSTLEKLGEYLKDPFNREALEGCDIKFSLMTYSLGNYLFQNYVVDSTYENETAIFDNVILCQADVDNKGHADWVDLIEAGKRIYVTINENDWVLKWSDANFQKDRLGRTAKNLDSTNANYFDFTDGDDVGKTHGLFYKKTNPTVKEFFTKVLNGGKGETVSGMTYDSHTNSYKFWP
jgi:esterase/lipase superfamily enzyme